MNKISRLPIHLSEKISKKTIKIAIIGLGYVGLPLAINFSKYFNVVAFDINPLRINQLKKSQDVNNDMDIKDFKSAKKILFTKNEKDLDCSDIYIITVPTPINKNKQPNLHEVTSSTKLISKYINLGNLIIYESTFYPGTIDDYLIPLIQKTSKFKHIEDFLIGYSPERINPGDKKNKLQNIVKVVSGSNFETTNIIDELYKKIIKAGTFKAKSIKIAEATKILENIQRDVNIALINEVTKIYDAMDISIYDVLKAASTKWNFLNFQPGLVGGHCISIDPYYLIHKAKIINESTELMSVARDCNESMSKFYEKKISSICRTFQKKNNNIKILICGLAFKENCSDTRNTKIKDLVIQLKQKNFKLDLYDPLVDLKIAKFQFKSFNIIQKLKKNYYDLIVLAVPHNIFIKNFEKEFLFLIKKDGLIFDLKNKLFSDNPKIIRI